MEGHRPDGIAAGRGGGRLPWAAGAVAGAALLGAVAAAAPELFHFDLRLTLSPRLLAGVVLGAAATAAVVRWPGVALVLLVVFIEWNLSQVLVRFHGMPSLLQLLVLPIGVAALLAAGRRGAGDLAAHPLAWLLAAWLCTLLVSTTRAWDRGLADAELAEALKGFVLFALAALLAAGRQRLRLAAWSLLAAASVLAGLALWQVWSGGFANEWGGLARIKQAQIYGDVFQARIAGPLGDPNYFAQILLVLVPLGLLPGWAGGGWRRRLPFAVAVVLATATVFTYSRGGALALALAAGLAVLVRGVTRRMVAVAAAGLLLALLFLPGAVARRLETLREIVPGGQREVLDPDSSIAKRRLVTRVAWDMFLDHPVLGVGAGNYATRFGPYAARTGFAAREYDDPAEPQYPHNLYLEIAAETGLVGLLLFAAVMVAAFGALARAWHRFRDAGEAGLADLAAALALGLAGYLASSLFLHGHFLRYLWLLLGLAAACDLLAGRVAAQRRQAPAGR
jgi:O-antigen ligase